MKLIPTEFLKNLPAMNWYLGLAIFSYWIHNTILLFNNKKDQSKYVTVNKIEPSRNFSQITKLISPKSQAQALLEKTA